MDQRLVPKFYLIRFYWIRDWYLKYILHDNPQNAIIVTSEVQARTKQDAHTQGNEPVTRNCGKIRKRGGEHTHTRAEHDSTFVRSEKQQRCGTYDAEVECTSKSELCRQKCTSASGTRAEGELANQHTVAVDHCRQHAKNTGWAGTQIQSRSGMRTSCENCGGGEVEGDPGSRTAGSLCI